MLIEIVQHESNKIVKEATLEQAIEYAQKFPVNLVDAEGNRTPFKSDEEIALPVGEVTELADETPAADAPAAEAVAEVASDAPAEG